MAYDVFLEEVWNVKVFMCVLDVLIPMKMTK